MYSEEPNDQRHGFKTAATETSCMAHEGKTGFRSPRPSLISRTPASKLCELHIANPQLLEIAERQGERDRRAEKTASHRPGVHGDEMLNPERRPRGW